MIVYNVYMELDKHCKPIRNQLRIEPVEDIKTYFKDPEWTTLEDIVNKLWPRVSVEFPAIRRVDCK